MRTRGRGLCPADARSAQPKLSTEGKRVPRMRLLLKCLDVLVDIGLAEGWRLNSSLWCLRCAGIEAGCFQGGCRTARTRALSPAVTQRRSLLGCDVLYSSLAAKVSRVCVFGKLRLMIHWHPPPLLIGNENVWGVQMHGMRGCVANAVAMAKLILAFPSHKPKPTNRLYHEIGSGVYVDGLATQGLAGEPPESVHKHKDEQGWLTGPHQRAPRLFLAHPVASAAAEVPTTKQLRSNSPAGDCRSWTSTRTGVLTRARRPS